MDFWRMWQSSRGRRAAQWCGSAPHHTVSAPTPPAPRVSRVHRTPARCSEIMGCRICTTVHTGVQLARVRRPLRCAAAPAPAQHAPRCDGGDALLLARLCYELGGASGLAHESEGAFMERGVRGGEVARRHFELAAGVEARAPLEVCDALLHEGGTEAGEIVA